MLRVLGTSRRIGAHMEKDIDVIVDVDPEEAQRLIWLIELLVKDWYITRHQRQESLKAIVAIKGRKGCAEGNTQGRPLASQSLVSS